MNDTETKPKFPAAKFLLALVFGLCVFFVVGHFLTPLMGVMFPKSLGGGNLVFLFSIQSANELRLAYKQRNDSLTRPTFLYLNLFNLLVGTCLVIYILISGHPVSYISNAIMLVSLAYISFIPAILVARSGRMNPGNSPRAA